MTQFKDPQGHVLAEAAIPDNYYIGGSLVSGFQHETVPFFITAHAIDAQRGISMYALTDEMFTDYRNQFIRQTVKAVPNAILTSFRDFIEPEDYLEQFAEAISQMELKPIATSDLPSLYGRNLQAVYQNMMAEYQASFDRETQAGAPTYPNNSICRSFLVKYRGVDKNDDDKIVFAGMDYKGVEYYTTMSPEKLFGGFLGGMFGNTQKKEEEGSKQFGHGQPCDAIDWGSFHKFCLITPPEYEDEALEDFLGFVSTFHMDESLRKRFYELIGQRIQENLIQSQQLQQMAFQSTQNLIASQQRLTQTLAQNSAAMSNMIMDSWNQKMASDSRISAARSEAIMGVNTYTNSYGQNVDVSVVADHVYQNQYGDVYGVSGNELDQSLLNKLNWTPLKK